MADGTRKASASSPTATREDLAFADQLDAALKLA